MKKYNITVNGTTYEVIVEEADGSVQAPVYTAPAAPQYTAPAAPMSTPATAAPENAATAPVRNFSGFSF